MFSRFGLKKVHVQTRSSDISAGCILRNKSTGYFDAPVYCDTEKQCLFLLATMLYGLRVNQSPAIRSLVDDFEVYRLPDFLTDSGYYASDAPPKFLMGASALPFSEVANSVAGEHGIEDK